MSNNLIELCQKLYKVNKEVEVLKENDIKQKEEIQRLSSEGDMIMIAISEVYEYILGTVPMVIQEESTVLSSMINIYVTLIKRELRDINTIPENIRVDVETLLNGE